MLMAAAERGERVTSGNGSTGSAGYYLACDDSEHPTYWQYGRRIAAALGCGVVVWPLWRWVGWTVGAVAEVAGRCSGQPSLGEMRTAVVNRLLNRDKIREATAASWACSAAKARGQLGFAPALPLDARLRQTAEWYSEHGWL